jgi:hypothetical protein
MPPLSATLNTFDSFLVLQKKFCRVPSFWIQKST